MPLVNLKPVLREAKAKGYAVAAFNPVDYASMKAMVKAAEELKAPVIIQSSAKTIKYYGHKAMIGWMREIADDSPGARRAAPRSRQRHRHDQEVRRDGLDLGHDRLVRQAVRREPRADEEGRRHRDESRHRRRSRDRRDPRRRGRHGRRGRSLHRSRTRPRNSAASSISRPSRPRSAPRTATTRASRT